jgi:type II secretory pathway pseudopilin PulG
VTAHKLTRRERPADCRPSEEGYTLLAVVFLMTVLTVWLAVAAPKMTRSIQRDHDLETMHRGKQYIRAIRLYYRKFHAYPPTIDALVQTNDLRFLRKRYLDPLTGKDDWKPIMYGQNKAPIAMGFFGQPLMGGAGTLAGIGPGGTNGLTGSTSQFGNSGQSGTFGSIFNSQSGSSTSPSPQSGTGSTDTSNGSTDPTNGGSAANGANGTTGTDANGNPISSTGTAGATNGQTFGGAGIVGYSPNSPKQSILVYKKKNHYNEWEFTYDPIMEQMYGAAPGLGLGTTGSGLNSDNSGDNGLGNGSNTGGGRNTYSGPPVWSPNGNLPSTPPGNNNSNNSNNQ